jgi:FKBP-type peptidyl-prolyl cis-trans isomerase FkpA
MRLVFFFIFMVFMACSCKNFRYPGYSHISEDFYCSLIQMGDKDIKPKTGDFLTVILSYKTMDDSVFFHGTRKFRLLSQVKKASLDHCFSILSPGDSTRFLMPAKIFFEENLHRSLPVFFDSKDMMKMDIRLLSIQTAKEYEKQKKEFLRWAKDMKINENVILSTFLKDEKINIPPVKEGFYLIPIHPGNGRRVVKGDHIWIRYKGKFLNGKFFDGTVNLATPVDFIYGTQMFLIEGLDQALSYLAEGEKVMVILPSSLAFGQEGSAGGIVPPFTSLIYELELVRIE